MQKPALARSFALACALLLPLACDDGGDGGTITGTTVATRTVTVGTAPTAVDLPGKRSQGAKVDFPIGVTKAPVMVTVNLNEGVKKRGAEVGGPIEIANQALQFETGAPAKMRQPLPPAPTGKRYVAVYALKEGDTWTILPTPPRVVGAGAQLGQVDAGVGSDRTGGAGGSVGSGGGAAGSAGTSPDLPAGEFDAGVTGPVFQPQTAQAELTTYEIDVTGTGYWGIGYEVAVTSSGGSGCPAALSKLKGCGFTIRPPGTDPCVGVTADESCEINCIAKASCPQLTTLYCGGTPTATDSVLQCVQACMSSVKQIPCGDGQSYTESDKCDGFAFCANGADEVGCVQFACGDGTTIPVNEKCDGFSGCANGSDEAGCPPVAQDPELYCPNGQPAFGSNSEPQTGGGSGGSGPGTTQQP